MIETSDKFKFLMAFFKAGAIIAKKLHGQGLNLADMAVLYTISQESEGKVTLTDLSERLGLTTSDTNRFLTNMEKLGAVKKQPQGRDNLISITETGTTLFNSAASFTELRCENLIPEDKQPNLESINKFLDSIK